MSGDTDTPDAAEAATTSLAGLLDPRGLPLRHRLGLLALVVLALLPAGRLVGVQSITMVSVTVPLGVAGISSVTLGGITLPLTADSLLLLDLSAALYFGMFAMSWDAVSGYTGQISFGHGLFFAVGGYTSALLNMGHGVDPMLSVPAGVVLAAVAGIVIGVPALRLQGPYLSLVTLVAPLILLQVFIFYSGIFGGELGLGSPENFMGFGLGDPVAVYYTAFVAFLLVLGILLAVTRSDAGIVFTAIREDEVATAAVGLNPAKFKTFAFVLSGAIGGFAGAMLVHTPVGNPQPSQLFTVTVNIEVIIAAILGGMGTIVGAAVGGVFLVMFREWLSGIEFVIPVLNAPVTDVDFLLFAVGTLVLLFVLPGGIVRWGIRAGRRAVGRYRDRRTPTPADGGRDAEDAPRSRPPSDTGTTPLHQVAETYRGYYEDLLGGDERERR